MRLPTAILIALAMPLAGCGLLDVDTDAPVWTPDRLDTDHTADTSDTSDTSDTVACPSDWIQPTVIEVESRILVVDGSQYAAELGSGSYDSVPVACVSLDGTQVQILLEADGAPFAWVRSFASGETNVALAGSTGAEFAAFGADPAVTFGSDTWFQGAWVVTADNGRWVHTIDGSALAGAQTLAVVVEIEVAP